jgi:hypothetical protein
VATLRCRAAAQENVGGVTYQLKYLAMLGVHKIPNIEVTACMLFSTGTGGGGPGNRNGFWPSSKQVRPHRLGARKLGPEILV